MKKEIKVFKINELSNYENISHWDIFENFEYFAETCLDYIKERYKFVSYEPIDDERTYSEENLVGVMQHPIGTVFPLFLTPDKYVKYIESIEQKYVEVEMYEMAKDCITLLENVKKAMKENTFENLSSMLKSWADDKNLLTEGNHHNQMKKVIEEIEEIQEAIQEDNLDNIKNEIGDGFVTLIILCHQLNLNPTECLLAAYNKISKRTGKTVNGIFVKD